MLIVKNNVEIRSVDQWYELAPPKKRGDHWVEGRSAFECARAWCGDQTNSRCPNEITALLLSHPDTEGAVVQTATPEHCCRFDKLPGEPRNADMVAVADHSTGRLAISIEAKADETFGSLVRNELEAAIKKIAADEPTNVVLRVQQLASALLPWPVEGTKSLGELRYQLLTAVAGALAFAGEVKANRAVFVVHEFITNLTDDAKHRANALDLDAFVARLPGAVSRLYQ
jgi:uncharacterized protein DUF6946